jgi:DNA polymerase III alpha subunit
MRVNEYGIFYKTEQELIDALYANPDIDVSIAISEPEVQQKYNHAAKLYVTGKIADYDGKIPSISPEEFHKSNQDTWFMPNEYKCFNIHQFLIDSCKNDEELARIAYEIGVYEERNLLPLLRYIKYLVDTMRENKIVWGVGRGSASASYVLFKIGIHKIDSIKFRLDVSEFFKE